MEQISVFDILKVGIGPSSSHTLGPWRAAGRFLSTLREKELFEKVDRVRVTLYGSLSLTGRGHYTDLAVILGLCGADPEVIPPEDIRPMVSYIEQSGCMTLGGERDITFCPLQDIVFEKTFLPFHSNGITFVASDKDGKELDSETYYSIGGGFVVQEGEKPHVGEGVDVKKFPYPIQKADELLSYTKREKCSIADVVLENEKTIRSVPEIREKLLGIWDVMLQSIYTGCHTLGELPGGLRVKRRAAYVYGRIKPYLIYNDHREWARELRHVQADAKNVFTWVSTFAIAVNEVNASLGRIVTAPTNGSSGVIPAVLLYYLSFVNPKATDDHIVEYLLVCGEIGSIFKKEATISAAQGGCQAEIGVSSAMAAAGLCHLMGGLPQQCLAAAEITMEHHLGLTCDPVGGLVQVPCIERNSMGAIKAITAAGWALNNDPSVPVVSLDSVIKTMWETALDMNTKYKETALGGLAAQVPVNHPDC
jgi:L-serine dehydratase